MAGNLEPFWVNRLRTLTSPSSAIQPDQRRNRISRSRAQPALHRKSFVDMDFDFGCDAKLLQSQGNHLPGRVALVGRYARIVRGDAQRGFIGRPGRNRHHIMHFQRLIDSDQRMKAVRPRRPEEEPQVDLGVRSDFGRHTGSL